MVALPVLKQSTAASLVTFGRLSKMIPMVPIGTRTCCKRMPFGRVHSSITWPTGSGSEATCSIPPAMASTFFASSFRRSSIGFDRPFNSPAARSRSLAARIWEVRARSSFAIASRIAFFCSVVSWDSRCAAVRALRARVSTAEKTSASVMGRNKGEGTTKSRETSETSKAWKTTERPTQKGLHWHLELLHLELRAAKRVEMPFSPARMPARRSGLRPWAM